MSGEAKGLDHVSDARIAVDAFDAWLAGAPATAPAWADQPLSVVGAVMQWAGIAAGPVDLTRAPVVIRA